MTPNSTGQSWQRIGAVGAPNATPVAERVFPALRS